MNRVFTEQILHHVKLTKEDLVQIINYELCLKCSEHLIKNRYNNLIFYTCKCGQLYRVS